MKYHSKINNKQIINFNRTKKILNNKNNKNQLKKINNRIMRNMKIIIKMKKYNSRSKIIIKDNNKYKITNKSN